MNFLGKTTRRAQIALLSGVCSAVFPVVAQAQDDSAAVEDIVVTAQRTSQRLQDVPIAVSAASVGELAAGGITSVTDLGAIAPGLNISSQTGSATIYMRGVGNNNNSAGQEQNIALYVDGVYYPSMTADLGGFANIERIEVIKGPQGTLFGRNTTGGLIQVITRDPTDVPKADVSVGYGNYQTVEGHAYVAGGIAENLAADISANYKDQGEGWGTNVTTGNDANKRSSWDVRSKIVWTPSDETKVTLVGAYAHSKTDMGLQFNAYSTTPASPAFGSAVRQSFYDSNPDVDSFSTAKQTTVNLKIEHEFGGFRATSITAYQNTKRHTVLDLDFTAAPLVAADYPANDKSFNQEIQLASLPGSKLTWIAGAQYFWVDSTQPPLAIIAGGVLPVALYNYGQKTQSYGVFGQATYPVTDQFSITVGGRYTYDKKRLYDSTLTAFNGVGYDTFAASGEKAFKNVSYKVAADYKITPDVMLYALTSSGFKAGLFNTTFNPGPNPAVKPEKLTDYEAGLKTTFLDRRVRLNLSGFYYDYKDVQYQAFVGNATVLLNAPKAEVYGGEIELDVSPVRNLRLGVATSYLHSEFTSSFTTVSNPPGPDGAGVQTGVDGLGKELQRSPKWTVDANIDYTIPTAIGEFGLNATYYYNDGFFWETDNRLAQPSYDLLNLSLRWKSTDEHLEARIWGKNVLGENYAIFGVSGGGSVESFTPAAPGTYGVTVGFHF